MLPCLASSWARPVDEPRAEVQAALAHEFRSDPNWAPLLDKFVFLAEHEMLSQRFLETVRWEPLYPPCPCSSPLPATALVQG